MQLDLSDSVSIQTFVVDVIAQFPQLDCLICNAGVLVPSALNDIHTDDKTKEADSSQEDANNETATWYPENGEGSNEDLRSTG